LSQIISPHATPARSAVMSLLRKLLNGICNHRFCLPNSAQSRQDDLRCVNDMLDRGNAHVSSWFVPFSVSKKYAIGIEERGLVSHA
jgi:hypothetical protein